MASKGYPTLVPQYMHQFSCIGSACEDTCCIGWRVSLDDVTFKKYKRAKHPDLEHLFSGKVTRNRSNPNKRNYAKIKMNKNNACPFLTSEKLCTIQLHLGEGYLSNTCAFYPRAINRVNGVLEISATMSCPEVARLALFNPEPMEFDQQLEIQNRFSVSKEIDTNKLILSNRLQRYFWELRVFTIQTLQNRHYKLWERLIILGLFYQKLEKYIEQERTRENPNLIANYTRLAQEDAFKEPLADIPLQPTIQMKLLKELADERFFQGINSPRYLKCFKEFLQGVEYNKESTEEEVGERYIQAYEEYYRSYMEEKEYILENYLVNYVFRNLFPLGKKSRTVFTEYVMLVIHYALIKMHLIGMAAFHQGLRDELVLKLIQSFAKTVEHNTVYLHRIRKLLQKSKLTTMAYMAILIKN